MFLHLLKREWDWSYATWHTLMVGLSSPIIMIIMLSSMLIVLVWLIELKAHRGC